MSTKLKVWVRTMSIVGKIWGCHQIPERSFFLYGYQLPLCARCTGIAIGYIIGWLLSLFFNIVVPIWFCVVLIVPTIIDGGLQLLLNIISNNMRRLVTGTFYGVGLIQLFINLANIF